MQSRGEGRVLVHKEAANKNKQSAQVGWEVCNLGFYLYFTKIWLVVLCNIANLLFIYLYTSPIWIFYNLFFNFLKIIVVINVFLVYLLLKLGLEVDLIISRYLIHRYLIFSPRFQILGGGEWGGCEG